MRVMHFNQYVRIPENVKAFVNAHIVTITGPRGTLKRSFHHLALDLYMIDRRTLKVGKLFRAKKEMTAIRIVCDNIQNMIDGVMTGLKYKMRARHIFVPLNYVIPEKDSVIVVMAPGVKIVHLIEKKDETVVKGDDIEDLSGSAEWQDETIVEGDDIDNVSGSVEWMDKTIVEGDEIKEVFGSAEWMDETIVEGDDIKNVSGSAERKDAFMIEGNYIGGYVEAAALMQPSNIVKNKDVGKLLDDLYISEKTAVVKDKSVNKGCSLC